jgi:excisionase family DNA binding protein
MAAKGRTRKQHARGDARTREWPEKLTVTQARRLLNVGSSKMTQLLRQNLIRHHRNPMDMREKLIRRSDLLAFLKKYGRD